MTQVIQIQRTERGDSPPGKLAPGVLFVEMAEPCRLWVGVPEDLDSSGRKLLFDSAIEVGGEGGIGEAPTDGKQYGRQSRSWTPVVHPEDGGGDVAGDFVKKSGDTMTGELINLANVKSAHFTVQAGQDNGNAQYRFNNSDATARGLLIQMATGHAELSWNRMTRKMICGPNGDVEFPFEGWKIQNTNFRGYVPATGAFNTIQMSDNWSYCQNRSDGHIYLKYGGANNAIWYTVNGNHFCSGVWVAKPGGGLWADSSDARIKDVIDDYTTGLDAVCALQPVRYRFKGNDFLPNTEPFPTRDIDGNEVMLEAESLHKYAAESGKVFVGLVAQEAEAVMPELVEPMTSVIDGVEVSDARSLDATALIYALVNACKELADRVADLEARVPQPKESM